MRLIVGRKQTTPLLLSDSFHAMASDETTAEATGFDPWPLLLLASCLLGLAIGLGGYTFVFAQGHSYLTDDAAACANCHIMEDQYSGWLKSSHRSVGCNGCHTPDGFFAKYATKASNGFWHSFAFTTGMHPDPIRIKPHNLQIAETRCRSCHGALVAAIDLGAHETGKDLSCTQCHGSVGHPR
jgi:cytochrome c nitrite reductase small subunit